MEEIYIILGSNIEPRLAYLQKAAYMINEEIGTIEKQSKIYVTEAWGVEDQEDYYNQVIQLQSQMKPKKLIQKALDIERRIGRTRSVRWAPRTIDIDILLIGNQVIKKKNLTIPHARMSERNFVLAPMVEMAPDLVHPVLKLTMQTLFDRVSDQKEVSILADDEPTEST